MFQESIESDIQYDCGVIGSAAILLVSALMFYSTRLVPLLIQFILRPRSGQNNPELLSLKRKVADLKTEMAQISAVDEFAKFARKQREIAKIQAEIHTIETTHMSSSFKARTALTFISYSTIVVFTLYTTYHLSNSPMFRLPSAWLKPFEGLQIWPLINTDSHGNSELSVVFTFGLFWRLFGLISR